MSDLRKSAKQITLGIVDGVFALIICFVLGAFVVSYFTPTDATDNSWLDRSGVKIFKDKGTGREFYITKEGNIIERKGCD